MSHFDPSWCARINAHRKQPEPPAAAPPSSESDAPSFASAAPLPASTDPAPAQAWPFKVREIPTEHVCERCGTVMYDHNCKIVCPNCGYKRDCSDP